MISLVKKETVSLGVTGGIGSGKSYVCKILEELGCPVFYADDEAKNILFRDNSVMNEVLRIFGDPVFTEGIPDRKKLAAVVFNDEEKLKQLNMVIHPAVGKAFEDFKKLHADKRLIAKEAAILIESGAYKGVDKVMLVTADEETRIKRVMDRDKVSREAVVSRMKKQMSEKEKRSYADFVLNNDEGKLIVPQLIEILKNIAPSLV